MKIFKKFNQAELIKKLNLIQGYIKDSSIYFKKFEEYLNDKDLSDKDKLICLRNQYLEFSSNHSILLKDK